VHYKSYPGPRTLFVVWLTLMALTVATMIAGKVTAVATVGLAWMVVLMAVTWAKSILILRYYLDLKAASGGWNKVFGVLVSLILIVVLALYAAAG